MDGSSFERVAQSNLEWIFSKLDSGFQSLVGFRIPSAGFRIPKPRIPDSTSKKIPGFRNPDSLTWGEYSQMVDNTFFLPYSWIVIFNPYFNLSI